MIEFFKAKKMYLLLLAVLFVFISLSDTTYSLFLSSNEISELNYNTGLLDLKFIEDEQITLEKVFPINDSDVVNMQPYVLRIQNTGTLPYLFDLSLIATNQDDLIDTHYIKVKVNDDLPINLFLYGNNISRNNIIYPGEEKSFKINVWLDASTPNSELGKKFVAKVVTSGSAIYKTLDNSGANYPKLKDGMIPVYYDNTSNIWKIADSTNMNTQNEWYNYNNQKWANVVILNESTKKVYDLTRRNDLNVNNLKINNGNLITEDNYLNIGLSTFNEKNISNIFRVKINDLNAEKIYFISNDDFSYYYDVKNKVFVLKNKNGSVNSNSYILDTDKWYLIGYTFDSEKVTFYINGVKLGIFSLNGRINDSGSSFLVATDSSHTVISKLTIGDILIYNRILSDSEISVNYKDSMKVINDGLFCGYSEFTPMTITEYYMNSAAGTNIDNNDVMMQFVWIPRYKYRVWNILGNNENSYDALNKGIEIVFENGNNSTGDIVCQNEICMVNGNAVTSDDNNRYYTHSAFNDSLFGFWISKYELSTVSANCGNDSQLECTLSNLPVQSKEGNITWRNNYLSNYYKAVTDSNYRLIKNIEWGAVAYLSHSNYGVCKNGTCQEINGNTTYIAGQNKGDTTTNNVYGVFDMAGGAMEYTMSNYTENGKLNSNFGEVGISNQDYELYKLGTFMLGDGTKEIINNNMLWYNNTYSYQNPSDKWIIRGGDSKNSIGIFAFTVMTDNISDNLSTRVILK